MHTTVAWQENIDTQAAWVRTAAIEDNHIRTHLDKIYIGDLDHLIGEHAVVGSQKAEVRFVSPSLRRVNPFYITPVDAAITVKNSIGEIFHPQSPVKLDRNEALEVEIKTTDANALEKLVVAFLAQGALIPLHGEIFTINAEATVTLALDAWAFKQMTFPDSLPVANYDVVGARVNCATGVFFRFVPVGEAFRPGGVVVQDVNGNDPPLQRMGGLGKWFSFHTVQPPGIEICASTASGATAAEILLDVIKR